MPFERPNYTQLPNAFFDALPDLEKPEMKVTLAILRETLGWQRDETKDPLSVAELVKRTGLSKTSVFKGLRLAIERGTVERRMEGEGGRDRRSFYTINFIGPAAVPKAEAAWYSSETNLGPAAVPSLDTRAHETVGKKEERKDPPAPRGEMAIKWGGVLEGLREAVPDYTYAVWLAPLRLVGLDGDVLLVEAPEQRGPETVERFQDLLDAIAFNTGEFSPDVSVRIVGTDQPPSLTDLEQRRREKSIIAEARHQKRLKRAQTELGLAEASA